MRGLLLLMAAPLFAQVNAHLSPEPMAVLKAMRVQTMGLWRLSACNDSAASVTLAPERFYLAFPTVHVIDPVRASAVLTAGQRSTRASVAASWVTRGMALATMLTGFGAVAASKTVTTALALGVPAGQYAEQQLQAAIPSMNPYTDSLLNGPVTLAAGACTTKSVFASKMPKPETVSAVLK